MAGVMVSVSTGVMNSVIGKLTTLLGEQYSLGSRVKRGIRFLRDELSSMNAMLQRLADMDEDKIDVQVKEWRNKVRELSYDIEDCIDRFTLRRHSDGDAKANFVWKTMRKMKMLWEDRQIAKEIQELKDLVVEEKERRDRYSIDQSIAMSQTVVLLDPRAPVLFEEVRDLEGIDGPREEVIQWLKGEEKQLRVVAIFGTGGQGKTTLAMEVYRKIDESFDCRAWCSVSRILDIKKLLRDILFQINKREYSRSESWDTEQLISSLREYLEDKRYFIIIDDIWSKPAWEHVKCALPTNNNRSRIITTTRIKSVAASCCVGIEGLMYEANSLSEEDSRRLFLRRTFCSSEDCPLELMEVANEILKKCGGLPLAIISIAGLLASKSPVVEVWIKIRNSISSAVERDSSIDQMKRILFLSYFDLPHYLKACFLYLSVFPEDYFIDTRDLIWRWVAEGLIPGQNRENMEQLGENYLNELINRSMIQPTKIGVDGTTVKFCRVHDVILDFIICQAVEDNFLTVLNCNGVFGNSSNKIRRLSLQSNKTEGAEMIKAIKNMSHLRSLTMFGFDIPEIGEIVPRFLNSQVMRVLNIQGAKNFQECNIEHIGSLIRMKYLRINDTNISKFPEQIGNLQHLEILDVRNNRRIGKLPANIVQLQKLVRLFIPGQVQLPDGIGNLQALEELSWINLGGASAKSIQGLGELTRLRILRIYWTYSAEVCDMEDNQKACISSLSKLISRSLRSLHVWGVGDSDFVNSWIVSCGPITPLRRLVLRSFSLSNIPSGIGTLGNLSRLSIPVVGLLCEEGLKILASLPMLLSLSVYSDYSLNIIYSRHLYAIGRQGFQRLMKFNFYSKQEAALKFEPGAMPKLQRLRLGLKARWQFKFGHGGLVSGLQHLSGLKHLGIAIDCYDALAEEVEELEDDMRDAAGTHPNRPILKIERVYQNLMKQHFHMKQKLDGESKRSCA